MAHRLADLIVATALGRFPDADGVVEVVPAYVAGIEAVVAMTGHVVVATDLDRAALSAAGADGFGGALSPSVLLALAGRDGRIKCLDVLLVAQGTGRSPLPERRDLLDHPRVRSSARWCSEVHVHGDERGLVTIAQGLGGVPQMSFEVFAEQRGHRLASSLLADGLGLVPEGDPVIVTVPAWDAAALRTAVGAGFAPVGSVVLIRPARAEPEPQRKPKPEPLPKTDTPSPEPRPEPRSQPEPLPKTDTPPPEPRPEPRSQPGPLPKTDTPPEPERQPEPKPAPLPKTDTPPPDPEPKPAPEPLPEPEPQPEPKPAPEPLPKTDTPPPEPEPQPEPLTKTDTPPPESKPEPEPLTKTDTPPPETGTTGGVRAAAPGKSSPLKR